MGFSKRKHITAAWPPLAASIKMLELSYGTMKKKVRHIFIHKFGSHVSKLLPTNLSN